jgi:hypothetical protein
MVQHHQRAAYFDFFDFEVGNRRGKYRFSIGLFSNISDMPLNTLAVDPFVFNLGKINRFYRNKGAKISRLN